MHNHSHGCLHANLRYCPDCQVAYCADCHQEWRETYQYWYMQPRYLPSQPYPRDGTWCGGAGGSGGTVLTDTTGTGGSPTVITAASCTHSH